MNDADFADYRRAHSALRYAIADLRCELVFRRLITEIKANFNPAQPRAPRGSPTGGQWIDAGSEQAPAFPRDGWTSLIVDGVSRPGGASLFLTAGGGSRFGVGGNRPPPEYTTMREVFPGLRSARADSILAPIDNFLGLSAPGDAANLAVTELQFQSLYNEMRRLDPDYRAPDRLQSLEQLSWQARNAYIGQMRLDRAAALYKLRGQIEPLQIETLRFLQRRIDARYEEALARLKAGALDIRLGRNEAIGNYLDRNVRRDIRAEFNHLGISTVRGRRVRVNSREYNTSGTDRTFTIPDVRVGSVAFDVTLAPKAPGSPQIRGFFRADFGPTAVVIVRPTALGQHHTYLITQPAIRSGR